MESKQIMDGCTAATHVAYAFSEVATIYPITPVASMGETADKWAVAGRKNLFGSTMEVREMESELGAAGATHGALAAGALATTFTASQGLLLMIPNMFKISGELLPAVFHVGARSVAAHALSIFGDHQDVMACRTTGFAMLASSSVQETMDLAVVAHLAAIDGSLPVLHFFDGWRTSNEMNTIDVIPYDVMGSLLDRAKVQRFRDNALNPDHPKLRGSAQNPDVYFQNREAANPCYDAFPTIVQNAMNRLAGATGRSYHLFDYYGAADADRVVVTLASSAEVVRETVGWLNANGGKTGVVNVHLFRPFSAQNLLDVIPMSVRKIAVLDRTKEPGALGEPLFLDVAAAVLASGRGIRVVGGRYGLSSKEFSPAMAKAVFDELAKPAPRHGFTVGIDDDVTHLSLPVDESDFIVRDPGETQCVFYGMGSDGTVGATRQAASILVGSQGLYAQAYFRYSAKKSGGFTISQLRFGKQPVVSEYSILEADMVICNKDNYVRRFELLDNIREGGVFLLNSSWSVAQMEEKLPASLKRAIARRGVHFFNLDAISIAQKLGLGVRVNTIMEAAFFSLVGSVDYRKCIAALKEMIADVYKHEGGAVVDKNIKAVDSALAALVEVKYPASWADAVDAPVAEAALPTFVKNVAQPCIRLLGNNLPVSLMSPDGSMPMGTTAYEKRRIAVNVPVWDVDKCVECTECSLVCPHAAIRPVLLDSAEAAAAPAAFVSKPAHGKALEPYRFRIQVYVEDCTGCGSCAVVCPGHALTMAPLPAQLSTQPALLDYAQKHVAEKPGILSRFTVNGSQFRRPLLQFSGACAGCGETPYVKLVTQLFGDRMIIANATGCSSIWGANFPSNAYCTAADGRGPAWGNSLFEDNAEYGFGMAAALLNRRRRVIAAAQALAADKSAPAGLVKAADDWIAAVDSPDDSFSLGRVLAGMCRENLSVVGASEIAADADVLGKKSVWAIGGDGWAYDIGFAGLDHVLAQNLDINILVLDTECYSNTGGQTSKATPLGAVMKYASDGKRTYKKDLGRMMMTYGSVYVASVALGANFMQTIQALREAEAYPGPSIVIAYCPCINHGIRAGMSHSIVEERLAVKAGYWQLYRYNPMLAAQGKEPLTVDYAAPDGSLPTFLDGEDRYADLKMIDPAEASKLRPELAAHLKRIYSIVTSQASDNSI